MLKFERSVLINAPIETVWAFHERSDVLDILTPPWQPVQALRREAGENGMLGVGAESEFRLWLGMLPVPWVARHVECEPPFLFADIQERGPVAHWLHRHRLEVVDGHGEGIADGDGDRNSPARTRLTDEIEYGLPGGAIAETLLNSWVNARLSDMFAYRHRVTRLACEQL